MRSASTRVCASAWRPEPSRLPIQACVQSQERAGRSRRVAALRSVLRRPRAGGANPLLSPGPGCARPSSFTSRIRTPRPRLAATGSAGTAATAKTTWAAGRVVTHNIDAHRRAYGVLPRRRWRVKSLHAWWAVFFGAAFLPSGGPPRVAGKRIREVKEEPELQLGRGTGADSLARRPRPAQEKTSDRWAPRGVRGAIRSSLGSRPASAA